MERCRVCWTPPLSLQKNWRSNPLGLELILGSAKVLEWAPFAIPTESPPHRRIRTTGPFHHTFTPSSSFVFNGTQKRGDSPSRPIGLGFILHQPCWDYLTLIYPFPFRPSASTLTGHPFFKQVCDIARNEAKKGNKHTFVQIKTASTGFKLASFRSNVGRRRRCLSCCFL